VVMSFSTRFLEPAGLLPNRKFIRISKNPDILVYGAFYGVRWYSTAVLGTVPQTGSNLNSESTAFDPKYRQDLSPGWSRLKSDH
jgi:hypothetical protein